MKKHTYKTKDQNVIFEFEKDQTKISLIENNNIISIEIPFVHLFDLVYDQAIELYKLGKHEDPGVNRRILSLINGTNAEVYRLDPDRVKPEYILFKEDNN